MAKKKAKAKKKKAKSVLKKKVGRPEGSGGIPNLVVPERGTPCPHCRNERGHEAKNTYPNGNRRVLCGTLIGAGCGKPFVIMRVL